jgi:CheY-like chemotaxis protein
MNSRTGIEPSKASENDRLPAIASALSAETEIETEEIIGVAIAESTQQHASETILLVEDEAFVRKVTAEVLKSAGYRLIVASSAREALEACCGYPEGIDLLLADVVMPGMCGRELAARFEHLCPRAQILLMTGYAEQLAFSDLAPNDKKYLAKPFSARMLLSRVGEVLDANRPRFRAQA